MVDASESDVASWRARYQPSAVRHFFSYTTRVSLELPLGWEQDDADHRGQARYVDAVEASDVSAASAAGERAPARLLVSVVPGPPEPAAREVVADAIVAELGPLDAVHRDRVEVDGFDATLCSFRAAPDRAELAVRVAAVSAEDRIVTVVASAPIAAEAGLDELVRAALTSIRIIP